jgi:hypothetical protein
MVQSALSRQLWAQASRVLPYAFEEIQLRTDPNSAAAAAAASSSSGTALRKVLVVYLGGVTFAEISAIRFLNQMNASSTSCAICDSLLLLLMLIGYVLEPADYDFLVATTKLVNGDTLMQSLAIDPIDALRKSKLSQQQQPRPPA